ncbi:MAG: hypothetical protein K6E51_12260 [Treponema sp.]|nr:hypothetical protein [Treponema sp.]
MINKIRYALIFIFSLLFLISETVPLYADSYTSYTTCTEVFNVLQKAELSPQKQELLTMEQSEYPFNITVTFQSQTENNTIFIRDTLVLVISYPDFIQYKDDIIPFLQYIKLQNYPYTIQLLIPATGHTDTFDTTPDDKSKNFTNDLTKGLSNGLSLYVNQIYDSDTTCALILQFSNTNDHCIITPGSGRDTTPSWLIKILVDACDNQKIPVDITSGSFPSLYRFNLFADNPAVSVFLNNDIPCAALTLPLPEKKVQETYIHTISNFFTSYKPELTMTWDKHYTILHLPHKHIFIEERLFVIGYLGLSVFSLLVLCGLSFLVGKNTVHNLQDFIKHWYHLPIILCITTISLQIGEWMTIAISTRISFDPILQFGLKLILTVLLLAILFMVQFFNRRETSVFLYTFHVTIISVINIFIFSTIDFSLFLLFACEYIAVYISRYSRKLWFLIFSLCLMTLPFIPYSIVIGKYAQNEKIALLVHSGLIKNVILALALQPIFITFFKIFLRLIRHQASNSQRISKKTTIPLAVSTSLMVIAIGVFFTISEVTLRKFRKQHNEQKSYTLQDVPAEHLSVSLSANSFIDTNSRIITIQSSVPAMRYIVTITSPTDVPIYDSITEYTSSEDGKTAQFIIPDGPPQKITISFIATDDKNASIIVVGLYEDKDSPTVLSREVVSIPVGE